MLHDILAIVTPPSTKQYQKSFQGYRLFGLRWFLPIKSKDAFIT